MTANTAIIGVDLVESIRRCLGDIDVVVGSLSIPARRHIDTLAELSANASGHVVVLAGEQAEKVLPLVSRLVAGGKVAESIVLLPRDLDAGWLGALKSGPWSVCLPLDASEHVVAHIGARLRAFNLVFDALGSILAVQQVGERQDRVAGGEA